MIKRIIRFSAENRYLVIAGTIVALAFAWWSMRTIPLDALPDLSDTQVIVYARWDRGPDIIEDQVTYPITTALLGAPKVKDRTALGHRLHLPRFTGRWQRPRKVATEGRVQLTLIPTVVGRCPLRGHARSRSRRQHTSCETLPRGNSRAATFIEVSANGA